MTESLRDQLARIIGYAINHAAQKPMSQERAIALRYADELLSAFDISPRSPHLLPDANEET